MMSRRLSLAVATAVLCVGTIHAQTKWEDFTSSPEGLVTEFRPTPFQNRSRNLGRDIYRAFTEPIGGTLEEKIDKRLEQIKDKLLFPVCGPYLGDLIFTESSSKVKGPISVQFQYYAVAARNINYPPLGEDLSRNYQLIPQGEIGKSCGSYFYTDLPATFPLMLRVPVLSVSSAGMKATTNGISAAFITYVAQDADGAVVSSGLLPALVCGSEQGHYYYRANGKEKIGGERDEVKENSSFDGLIVKTLPDFWPAYNDVGSIWLTQKLLNTCAGQENLLRRLLMTGLSVSGPTSVVTRLHAMVGMPSGIRTIFPNNEGGDAARWDIDNNTSYSERNFDKEKNLLGTSEDVFDHACSRRFGLYSLACFGVFLVGAAIILVIVFFRLKGERRIVVWWLLPGWTVAFSVFALIGGLLTLDRRSKTDYTEIRFSVAGWPEMLCHANVKTLSFNTANYDWNLPRGADLSSDEIVPAPVDRFVRHCNITESAQAIRVLSEREHLRGKKKNVVVNWFEKTDDPFVFTGAKSSSNAPVVSVTRDMDDVFVRLNDQWHRLGSMKAGEKKEVVNANLMPPAGAIAVDLSNQKVCKNCGRIHGPETGEPLGYPKMVDSLVGTITLGVKRDTPLRAAPVWKGQSVEKGRTIWVTKWQ